MLFQEISSLFPKNMTEKTSESRKQKKFLKFHCRLKLESILEKRTRRSIAYLLISTEAAADVKVMKAFREIEGVEEAYRIYGIWDVVAKIKAATVDKLKEIVTWRLRRLEGVRSAQTLIVSEGTK